jgi:hypothetical protein
MVKTSTVHDDLWDPMRLACINHVLRAVEIHFVVPVCVVVQGRVLPQGDSEINNHAADQNSDSLGSTWGGADTTHSSCGWKGPTAAALCQTQSAPCITSNTAALSAISPTRHSMFGWSHAAAGFGTMSNEITCVGEGCCRRDDWKSATG